MENVVDWNSALPDEPIVAIGLLTRTHMRMLKDSLPRVFPIASDGKFDDLLEALDRAEEERRAAESRDDADDR